MSKAVKTSNKPDFIARVFNSIGYFRGKARLVDFLGRSVRSRNHGLGTFPLPNGKTVTIDLGDRIQRLMWGAAYEPHVRRCITALLRPGDTFVDVGSHIGFLSLLAASVVGNTGEFVSVEADPELFRAIQANVAEHPWIKVADKAVWEETGSISFSNPRQPGETGWGKVASVRTDGNTVSVEAMPLDDWYESAGLPTVRMLKLDAE